MAVYYKQGLADGVEFIRNEERAIQVERSWASFVQWIRYNPGRWPNGYHHMGMHWTEIYQVLSNELYKTGVLRVVHKKLGPKNITCLRKERLPSGRIRWVVSYHWEGHCPACRPPTLARREPAKLIRRSEAGNPEPAKLIRCQVAKTPKLIRRNRDESD